MKSNTALSTFPGQLDNLLNPVKFLPVYLERKNSGTIEPPHSVELHLTAACNFRCMHCSYSLRNMKRRRLDSALVDRLLDDLTGPLKPKGIYFSGGGEPTTMAGWDTMMARCLNAGIETALVTNGSLLKQEHMPLLGRLSYVAVSIYSVSQSTYVRITGADAFKAQFDIPGRIRASQGTCTVGARCVLNNENALQARAIYGQAMDAGYDYVIFIPAVDYENRGVALGAEQRSALAEQALTGDFDPARTNFAKLAARGFGYYPAPRGQQRSYPCHVAGLGVTAFVNYDGRVHLCQPDIGNQGLAIGSLFERPMSSFWGGRRHRRVVDALNRRWRDGGCANCRAIAYNEAAWNYEQSPCNTPLSLIKDAFL